VEAVVIPENSRQGQAVAIARASGDQPAQQGWREAPTLALTCAATAVALTVFTLPFSTLLTLAQTLHAGAIERTWMLSSCSVGLGAGLLVSGALADKLGRRTVFVGGAALQAVFLFGGAAFSSPTLFIVARVGQGLGAAALTATSLGLIAQVTPPGHRRARAVGLWGASLGSGIIAGPLIAALLAPAIGWRSPYLLVGLLSIGLAVFARVLPSNPHHPAASSGNIDYIAAAALIAGPSALLAGLILGRSGWTQPTAIALLAAGIAILACFVFQEKRTRFPLIDLTLFSNPEFATVTCAALVAGFGVIALASYTPTLVDGAMRGSALSGSLPIVIWSGVSVAVALLVRHLHGRVSPNAQLSAGLIVIGIGLIALVPLHVGDTVLRLAPGFVIAGIGTGLLNAALGAQAVATVPPHHASMGSGVNNTARYLGSALGVAVVTSTINSATPEAQLHSWTTPVIIAAVISVLAGLAIPLFLRATRTRDAAHRNA
jgi:MFS family permease